MRAVFISPNETDKLEKVPTPEPPPAKQPPTDQDHQKGGIPRREMR